MLTVTEGNHLNGNCSHLKGGSASCCVSRSWNSSSTAHVCSTDYRGVLKVLEGWKSAQHPHICYCKSYFTAFPNSYKILGCTAQACIWHSRVKNVTETRAASSSWQYSHLTAALHWNLGNNLCSRAREALPFHCKSAFSLRGRIEGIQCVCGSRERPVTESWRWKRMY